jgi:hypothetical protein
VREETEKCPYQDRISGRYAYEVVKIEGRLRRNTTSHLVISNGVDMIEDIEEWFSWAVNARRTIGWIHQWVEYNNVAFKQLVGH